MDLDALLEVAAELQENFTNYEDEGWMHQFREVMQAIYDLDPDVGRELATSSYTDYAEHLLNQYDQTGHVEYAEGMQELIGTLNEMGSEQVAADLQQRLDAKHAEFVDPEDEDAQSLLTATTPPTEPTPSPQPEDSPSWWIEPDEPAWNGPPPPPAGNPPSPGMQTLLHELNTLVPNILPQQSDTYDPTHWSELSQHLARLGDGHLAQQVDRHMARIEQHTSRRIIRSPSPELWSNPKPPPPEDTPEPDEEARENIRRAKGKGKRKASTPLSESEYEEPPTAPGVAGPSQPRRTGRVRRTARQAQEEDDQLILEAHARQQAALRTAALQDLTRNMFEFADQDNPDLIHWRLAFDTMLDTLERYDPATAQFLEERIDNLFRTNHHEEAFSQVMNATQFDFPPF